LQPQIFTNRNKKGFKAAVQLKGFYQTSFVQDDHGFVNQLFYIRLITGVLFHKVSYYRGIFMVEIFDIRQFSLAQAFNEGLIGITEYHGQDIYGLIRKK
jgi:hypothetical protein